MQAQWVSHEISLTEAIFDTDIRLYLIGRKREFHRTFCF
jgi:hypothetical protein